MNQATLHASPADPRFAAWLLEETGIEAESLGPNALSRALAARAVATLSAEAQDAEATRAWTSVAALPDWARDAYWQRLTTTPAERQALIDALVVPETWFFREREAFAALARLGAKRLEAQPGEIVRVLSAPCSTGEEPYSAAMALFDAGLAPGQFAIDAIDISAQSIAAAERGIYGRNAFRGDGLAFRERYFTSAPDGWRIAAAVQRAVTFECANLFDWLAAHPVRYDFVYCRNVLIYFDRAAQDRAIGLLRARLAAGGMIFVGPAETGLMMRHEMASAYIPLAFGFRAPEPRLASDTARDAADEAKRARAVARPAFSLNVPLPGQAATASGAAFATLTVPVPATPPARRSAPPPLTLRPLHGTPAPRAAAVVPALTPAVASTAATSAAKPASDNSEAVLANARRLADAGALDEAERLAKEAAKTLAQNADTWYLLGLIADAQGRSADAHAHYRKAVYLEPAHYEALTHLAALLEVQGDADGARRLMRRAERAAQEPRDNPRYDGGKPGGARV
ncbi:CheR family methyltransferase [Paraburkholderia acidisoli]|uniref:Methyltransferase n=1 Tax=Paraburkholderia acidisoli TaxID=2571748 RepID=A0A7Z2GR81_9BURK|nr:CheR family methyltransferase [Paraburkholderia acidisoli]QGZ66482.1 methyltransferase [Paraburkholderia acidisoli]